MCRSRMNGPMRRAGLDIVGDVPWGTHFCQFYQSPQDLLDVLVGYFRQGLEDNEFCMWVTLDPLGVEEIRRALCQVPNSTSTSRPSLGGRPTGRRGCGAARSSRRSLVFKRARNGIFSSVAKSRIGPSRSPRRRLRNCRLTGSHARKVGYFNGPLASLALGPRVSPTHRAFRRPPAAGHPA
jgi:hypothetical protein